MAYYALIKHLHLATIVVTLTLFLLRGVWMLMDSPRLQARWTRIVPHINDSLLLASGIALAALMQQYPLVHGWLTAKLFALIAYIVLGTARQRRDGSPPGSPPCWFSATCSPSRVHTTPSLSFPENLAQIFPGGPELSSRLRLYAVHLLQQHTWGPTWLRRGSQSSVGHTEGQST
ncbi:MAG: SirB2 family protein, partial [Thiobacillaceae bacterium]|nr:SirB2 family protein [Thiobacillaceae bacterium]